MNYKNIFFSIFFLVFLSYMQPTPAMKMIDKQRIQQTNNILLQACGKGNFGLVKHLIEKGANVNSQDDLGGTPLHYACKNRHTDIVKYLLENGAHVNAEGYCKWTSLHVACELGFYEIAKELIEKGANIHAEDSDKITPLYATCTGTTPNLLIIELLLEKGADIHAGCRSQNTVLHVACEKGFYDIVKYLIERGAHVNAENCCKNTPLFFAASGGYLNIVKLLIQNKADINCKTIQLATLLHSAAYDNQVVVVRYLLSSAPQLIEAQTVDGFTALDMAYLKKNEAIIKLFSHYNVRTVSEQEAEKNMRIFFAELDEEALRKQVKREQKKQKKLQNKENKVLQIQTINNSVVKQNVGGINQKVSSAVNNVTVLSPASNNSVVSDDFRRVLLDKSMENNIIATNFAETAITTISDVAVINNAANKSTNIYPLISCINNFSVSNNEIAINTKKQQGTLQTSCNRSIQLDQPIRTNNAYQIGHDVKLKWPRSLNGTKYDLMRDHLRQLKRWPETIGLDIKSLKGQLGMFRLRVGGYRVLFTVNEAQRRIIIHEIGLRKNVYRGL